MYKIVYERDEDEEKKYGNYNTSPPNLKECSEDDFFSTFSTYMPKAILNKQVMNHPVYGFVSLQMFIYDDGNGIAIGNCGRSFGRKYFTFALCEHTFVGVPEQSRMCYHVSRCAKCGIINAVDSSG